MSFQSDYHRLTDRFHDLVARIGPHADLQRVSGETRQDIGDILHAMAHLMERMPTPMPFSEFEATTPSTMEGVSSLMDSVVTHETAHQRRLLVEDLNRYAAPLVCNAHHNEPIRLDMIAARWDHQAGRIAKQADRLPHGLIEQSGAYNAHPVTSFPPEKALEQVGLGDYNRSPDPVNYRLSYHPVGPGSDQGAVMGDALVDQINMAHERSRSQEGSIAATIRAFVPSAGINAALYATAGAPVVVRYSTNDPDHITIAAQDRCPVRVLTPQSASIDLNDKQQLIDYNEAVLVSARTQPLDPEVRTRRLNEMDYRVQALEQITPCSVVNDPSLGQHYLNECSNIQDQLKTLASEIDPSEPDDRRTLRHWASLYARTSGDDSTNITFAAGSMPPYEAVTAYPQDYDGLLWADLSRSSEERGFDVMNALAAYGARDTLHGDDLARAESRTRNMLEGEQLRSSVNIAYTQNDTITRARSKDAAIRMSVSRLDLLNAEEQTLKHRLAMAAATHPQIDAEDRYRLATDIHQMDHTDAQGIISMALEEQSRQHAPGL